jgi:glucose-1-phosphate cytidylyltransferase
MVMELLAIDTKALLNFTSHMGKDATLLLDCPQDRFRALDIVDGEVRQFQEKPRETVL